MEAARHSNAETWNEVLDAATGMRRELHRHPELTWQEHATAERIRGRLDAAGIVWRACAGTGTVARLATDAPGRHIALRADIDALPIVEASGVEWTSTSDGVMHACGHDGHTATLLATATWLKRHEAALPGPVTLLFQPAEEGGHGAREMIADGALDGVDAVFGWHNWPAIAFGRALCPDGVVMCANGSFAIGIDGVGGHASQPEHCRDPVLAAAAITVALQQIVSRRSTPQDAAVVSVTALEADSIDTVIPAHAAVRGSIRATSLVARRTLEEAITAIAEATARAHGVTATVSHRPRYGPTVNTTEEAAAFRAALADELGNGWDDAAVAVPIMASEDFSYYLERVPGAFALIGAGEHDDPPSCHSPYYDFNDRLLAPVARLYLRLAGAPLPDA